MTRTLALGATILLFTPNLLAGVQFSAPAITEIAQEFAPGDPFGFIPQDLRVCRNRFGTDDLVLAAQSRASDESPYDVHLLSYQTTPAGSATLVTDLHLPQIQNDLFFQGLGQADSECSQLYFATGSDQRLIRFEQVNQGSLQFFTDLITGEEDWVRYSPTASNESCSNMFSPYTDQAFPSMLNDSLRGDDVVARMNCGFFVATDFSEEGMDKNMWMYADGQHAEALRIADVDRDGFNDVLALSSGYNPDISIWRGNGSGQLEYPDWYENIVHLAAYLNPDFAYIDGAYEMEVADINQDGDVDILVTVYGITDEDWYSIPRGDDHMYLLAYLGDGAGHFEYARIVGLDGSLSWGPNLVALEDVDRDGKLDLITTPSSTAPGVKIFRGVGGTELFSSTATVLPNSNGVFFQNGIRFADVDGDGRRDLVTLEIGEDFENAQRFLVVRRNLSTPPRPTKPTKNMMQMP